MMEAAYPNGHCSVMSLAVCTRHKVETQIIELGDSPANEPVLVSTPDPALCYRAIAFVCLRGRKRAFVSLIA